MTSEAERTLNYIKNKVPEEIAQLGSFLAAGKLAVFLITRKNAGKGTYIGLLNQLFPAHFTTISAGDLVRNASKEIQNGGDLGAAIKNAFPDKPDYIEVIRNFSLKRLLPTALIEFLIERALKHPPTGRSFFIDGFPRAPEQLTFTEKFVGQLKAEGFKVLFLQIELADEILIERRGSRRVCPRCGAIGNMTGIKGGRVDYNPETAEFFLRCEKAECAGEIMMRKAGYQEETEELKTRDDLLLKTAEILQAKYPDNFLFLRSDLPVEDFHGDEEGLNHLTRLSYENGEIKQNEERKTAFYDGREVFELHPRGVLPIIIKKIVKQLK